uniref:Disease resistance N-terminal domain-containing protein n=1 Tax=Ananas comosus var. bracteatus TaxID=296719 RepID=A0A6V7Q8P1_ANACO|nr:unnamed protein product [Ananas comosus var. bracteatus]
MAEAAVFHVHNKIAASLAGKALDTISDELEVSAFLAVKNSMKQIESEFAVMRAFMSQVNAYDSRNETLAAWLEQVKKVAFEVEDIIDEYTYLVRKENVGGFRNSVKNSSFEKENVGGFRNSVKNSSFEKHRRMAQYRRSAQTGGNSSRKAHNNERHFGKRYRVGFRR